MLLTICLVGRFIETDVTTHCIVGTQIRGQARGRMLCRVLIGIACHYIGPPFAEAFDFNHLTSTISRSSFRPTLSVLRQRLLACRCNAKSALEAQWINDHGAGVSGSNARNLYPLERHICRFAIQLAIDLLLAFRQDFQTSWCTPSFALAIRRTLLCI